MNQAAALGPLVLGRALEALSLLLAPPLLSVARGHYADRILVRGSGRAQKPRFKWVAITLSKSVPVIELRNSSVER